ncbi:MAG TPA: hypothetical protein ENI12_05155, partial [Nitrospirae bacterium]|nr:hypothetical protein [Nitrospirota bacterium]
MGKSTAVNILIAFVLLVPVAVFASQSSHGGGGGGHDAAAATTTHTSSLLDDMASHGSASESQPSHGGGHDTAAATTTLTSSSHETMASHGSASERKSMSSTQSAPDSKGKGRDRKGDAEDAHVSSSRESQGYGSTRESSFMTWMIALGGLVVLGIILFALIKGGISMSFINNLKVGTRIFGTVLILLTLLLVVSGVSFMKMTAIGDEVADIAGEDLPLISTITVATVNQLNQSIWYEKVMNTALQNNMADMEHAIEEYNKHAELVREGIAVGERIAEMMLRNAKSDLKRREGEKVIEALKSIDRHHDHFTAKSGEVFRLLHAGNMQEAMLVSADVHKAEEALNIEVEEVLNNIGKSTEDA